MISLISKFKIFTLFTLVLGFNLSAFIFAYEDWPFTNAPMFAHYVDEESPRYKFTFLAEDHSGKTQELRYANAGLRWMAMRHFFKYVYGSVEGNSPFNIYPNDNLLEFEARLSQYFMVFHREVKKRGQNYRLIHLQLDRLTWDENQVQSRTRIGTFHTETKKFTHTFQDV